MFIMVGLGPKFFWLFQVSRQIGNHFYLQHFRKVIIARQKLRSSWLSIQISRKCDKGCNSNQIQRISTLVKLDAGNTKITAYFATLFRAFQSTDYIQFWLEPNYHKTLKLALIRCLIVEAMFYIKLKNFSTIYGAIGRYVRLFMIKHFCSLTRLFLRYFRFISFTLKRTHSNLERLFALIIIF